MYVKFVKSVNEYVAGTVIEMPKKYGQPYVDAKTALEVNKDGTLKTSKEAPEEVEVEVVEDGGTGQEPDNGQPSEG